MLFSLYKPISKKKPLSNDGNLRAVVDLVPDKTESREVESRGFNSKRNLFFFPLKVVI